MNTKNMKMIKTIPARGNVAECKIYVLASANSEQISNAMTRKTRKQEDKNGQAKKAQKIAILSQKKELLKIELSSSNVSTDFIDTLTDKEINQMLKRLANLSPVSPLHCNMR